MWRYVTKRFTTFLENIRLTSEQVQDGTTKNEGVRGCLNRHYYDSSSNVANSLLVGSWGKKTRVRPPRDVDVLFELPTAVYHRFSQRTGNVQSQILQEVRGVLLNTYPNTQIKGDGPIVLVPFTSYAVEVLPAFRLTNGQYWICDATGGGRYKVNDPSAEIKSLEQSDSESNGNTRHLIRMMKTWQRERSVPIKSFHLELLIVSFVASWPHKGQTAFYYDWIVRDFLAYMLIYAGGTVFVPGTSEGLPLGNEWVTRTQSAHSRAVEACEYERDNLDISAGTEWQKIFGTEIPLYVE